MLSYPWKAPDLCARALTRTAVCPGRYQRPRSETWSRLWLPDILDRSVELDHSRWGGVWRCDGSGWDRSGNAGISPLWEGRDTAGRPAGKTSSLTWHYYMVLLRWLRWWPVCWNSRGEKRTSGAPPSPGWWTSPAQPGCSWGKGYLAKKRLDYSRPAPPFWT